MYSKLCKGQELNDAGSITTLLSSLANNNIEISPAVNVTLDLCLPLA